MGSWDWSGFIQGLLTNAIWDVVKYAYTFKLMGLAGVVTFIAAFVSWIRNRPRDWWVLGSIFIFSLFCFYVSSLPLGSSSQSQSVYSFPEEQTKPLDPRDSQQRKRLEFGELLQQEERTWHQPQPGGFTKDEYSRLVREFLKIPRPCVFRITVPPENFNIRRDLYQVVTNSFVYRLDST